MPSPTPLSDTDAYELAWWRHFASKCEPGFKPPRPGSALLGHRLVVQVRDRDDALRPWGR